MTAIAGRRMAETVARRGGLTVIPQDIPAEVVARRRRLAVKSRHLVYDTPITADPDDDGRRGAGAAPEARPRRRRRRRRRPPGRHRHRGRPHRRRPVHPGRRRHGPRRRDRSAPTSRPRTAFDTGSHARHRLAPVVADDGRLVGILTRQGALRAHLYRPPSTTHGRLRVAAAVGINGDVGGQGQGAARRRRRRARHRHRARPPGEDARGAARRARPRPESPDRRRQRRVGAGHPRPDRGRRRHRQGRGRPGRDVHDADDDRRRPPAVLRGARVRDRGARARARTSGPTAACGIRATSPSPWPPAPRTS